MRLLLPLVALLLGPACILTPCGSWEVVGTTTTDFEGAGYDGRYHESCTADGGTSGSWNLFGDGTAGLDWMLDAPGHRGWQAVDFEITTAFPTASVVTGATIRPPELVGLASIVPGTEVAYDEVGLTDGEIEVLEGFEGDPCEGDGPLVRLRWRLVYGGDDGPRYESHGTDAFLLSNFLSEDCGGL